MPRRIFATAALAAALLAPAAAHAQNPLKFGVAVGPSFATGDLKDAEEWGYNVAGSISVRPLMMPVGLRIEGMYQNLTGKKGVSDGDGGTFDAPDFRTWAGTANAEVALPGMGISPYLIGGIGIYGNKFDVSGSESSNDFGFNLGGVLAFNLAGFSTFVEARFHQVNAKDDGPGGTGETAHLRFVPVTFGIKF